MSAAAMAGSTAAETWKLRPEHWGDSARKQQRPLPAKWFGPLKPAAFGSDQIVTSCNPIGFNHPLAGLLALRWPGQFVGYVGEESPVEWAWFEEEKSSCSKRAILSLLSCSSFKRFSLSCIRFSLSSDSILSFSVSCSMS